MNIFIAKLNSESNSEDLQKLFSHYGEVSSARVILDKETGHSKRYGFVEMPNESEAKEALKELNETEFQQSVIVVKESRPRNQPKENPNQPNVGNRQENRQRINTMDQKSYKRENQTFRNSDHRIKKQVKSSQRSFDNWE